MKKALVSFGYGPHKELIDFVYPTFKKYSEIHSYDLFVMDEQWLIDVKKSTRSDRPYSWYKLWAIDDLFAIGYESVLWLDADVIIKNYELDILEDVNNEHDCGVVLHDTPDGMVPNLGVWVLKNKPVWFDELWNITKYKSNGYWWEQASFISLMNINPDEKPLETDWRMLDYIGCTSLPYRWNPHKNDKRGIIKDLNFFHSTMFKNRLLAMKEIINANI